MTTMKLGIRMRMLNQFIGLYIREVKDTYKNPAVFVKSKNVDEFDNNDIPK